jgi:serine/threonine-protein kinase
MALAEAIEECLHRLTNKDAARRLRRVQWTWATAAGLAVAAALMALALHFAIPASSSAEKSIAVLPLRNLGQNPADAFFAEGVQDDLISRLVKIRDLKVISRLGTARYPASPRNPKAIGRELGVRNLLEGSVRRAGDRVFLHVSLIDTRDGHEIWSESYDRKLADAIYLQGELAGTIAETLDARLSPQESAGVRGAVTHNPDAYVLYLRGRKFERSPALTISDFEAAQVLYEQAIAIDPGFALAHARLASTLGLLYRFRGPNEELKKRAYREAREALRLQPGLGEAHLVNGLCAYRIDRDFARALPELVKANRLLPNDAEAESFMAYIHRRRGEWRKAHAGLERCQSRDPNNATYAEELYTTSYLIRDWPAARRHALRAAALEPSLPLLKVQQALVDMWQNGDLSPLQEVFASLTAYGDPEGTLTWMRWDSAMLARNFEAAQAAIDEFPFDTLSSVYSAPVPKSYLEGCIALAQGEDSLAQKKFDAARPVLEAETLAHPVNALRHARLGLLYAYLGRKADAIREGNRAVELQPMSEDAFDGPENASTLALIHTRLGDNDAALDLIEQLLRKPGGVFFYEASMSLSELRLRWQWDPLRKDPRFQRLLAEPEPATHY